MPSYVCTGRVNVGTVTSGGFGGPYIIMFVGGTQTTIFDKELKIGQTISWVGLDALTYTRVVGFIYGQQILSVTVPIPPEGQRADTRITAYYDYDVYSQFPMTAADCKVLNLWDGAGNGSASYFLGGGVPSDPRVIQSYFYWYQEGYDDSFWPGAVAVTPDPEWSEMGTEDVLPLPSGSDYIWSEQSDNVAAINPDTNAAEQLLVRWRVTIPDPSHLTVSDGEALPAGNQMHYAHGSLGIPNRTPSCSGLGHSDFIRNGNAQLYVNGFAASLGDQFPSWTSYLREGVNLIAWLINDARFLTGSPSECPGGAPWQPWISTPWVASGITLHGFAIGTTHTVTTPLTVGIGGSAAGQAGRRSYGMLV